MTGHFKELVIRFFKFGIVGGSGVVVNLGVYVLLTRLLGLGDNLAGKYLSYAASVEVSIITNFLLNDFWTFADRRQEVPWRVRFSRFHLVSLVGMAINWGFFAVLNWLIETKGWTLLGDLSLFGWHTNLDDLVSACLGIIAAMAWNFFGNLLWTWKKGAP
jgi:dolichol-phosphate mannosyltransferase